MLKKIEQEAEALLILKPWLFLTESGIQPTTTHPQGIKPCGFFNLKSQFAPCQDRGPCV